ncbi:SDR family oxidoreductase [Radicibacter daui]|uniref:SDR family oxidoreductase n=1 Tax=Radicibacter daui TaxID=3064829 RepID=UPI0040469EEA
MSGGSVLVLGGSSDIGLAIARAFAAEGHDILLAARRPAELAADCADIGLRHGVKARALRFDALEIEAVESFLDGLEELPAIVVCCVGVLGDQPLLEQDPLAAAGVIRANFEGPALVLGALANRFEARGSGVLVGVSSVAGDRGRARNYVYGAAKAGFTAFLSGLRNRLASRNVHVMTVKPGFVATRMIAGLKTPPALTALPQEVAMAVLKAVRRRRDVVYVRRVWWLVMRVICAIPERFFKRLNI